MQALALMGVFTSARAQPPAPLPLAEAIEIRLQTVDEDLFCKVALPRFYGLRQYMPAWLTPRGMQRDIPELLETIEASAFEGLRPADYHRDAIQEMIPQADSLPEISLPLEDAARLELLLTDAFLLLGSHFTAGRINPESIDPEWFADRRQGDMPQLLEKALENGSVRDSLLKQLPRYPGYRQLKATYRRYLEMDQGTAWPPLPPGDTLQRGDRHPRVALLRMRLSAGAERPLPANADPDFFDEDLEADLIRFQRRHGLDADGRLGRRTLEALNVSLGVRLQQLAANLERWRWLPDDLGPRHILVNIADYRLEVVDNTETMMEMGVIVGKPFRHTPVFSGLLRYLVFNPSWYVPHSIAVRDKLPLIRKDPAFFNKQQMRLYALQGKDWREIDPLKVDWPNLTAASFNFRMVQAPGPNNALGQVKFMFPNRFNVYLHDTPSRELFAKTARNLSSGCIRLSRPIDLAALVLHKEGGWDRQRIDAVLATGQETTVNLSRPLPVHLLYWTVFIDTNGEVCFREDIYGRDRRLIDAMEQKPGG